MDILALELRKLGLKENEVELYLAGLELGPSAVQVLAKKAGVTRPTAYEIIGHLKEKGLFAETKQGKKRLFFAQSPEKILGILRLQKRELEEKEREFIRIIASLESKYALKEGGIKLFRGREALEVLREQLLFTPAKEIMVFFSETGAGPTKKRKELYLAIEKRLGKIQVKEKRAPKLGGTLFVADKLAFFSAAKQEGFVIDNSLVVAVLRNLV